MVKLVIFDWNGTLIADTSYFFKTSNIVLRKYVNKEISMSEFKNTFTPSLMDFFIYHGINKDFAKTNFEEILSVTGKNYKEFCSSVRTRKNVKKVLFELKQKDMKLIVLSNYVKNDIADQLERLNLSDYFDEVLAFESLALSTQNNKLGLVEEYLKGSNINKNEILIVGDSPDEISIAKKIGLTSVSLSNGYYSDKRLKNSNPSFFITEIGKLLKIININQKKIKDFV